ncbi:ABC transporter permease, partial [Nanoarchaeota archaeon]
SLSLIVIIVAEMFVGSVNGLGHAILDAQFRYAIPEMYALIIITGLAGYFLNSFFVYIEKNLIHWT